MITNTRTDTLNDALERLADYAFVDGGGFACHGPMGAEALSALGYDDAVPGWVEAYKATHPAIDAPPASRPIDPADEASWRSALGDFARVGDWATLFDRELRERPWQDVFGLWAARLLPGYGGGMTHGLLRVAHGVRSVGGDRTPTELQREELGKGLAAWAGWFTTLPGQPQPSGSRGLDEAIAAVPRPAESWTPLEAGTFSRIGELPDFSRAVDALRPPGEQLDAALGDLTATFCRLLVTRPDVIPIGLVHAVTPVAASASLRPLLADVAPDALYAQLWQVNAGIVAGFVPATGGPAAGTTSAAPIEEREPPSPGELSARAVEHRDAHVVKFTEACLREHANRPDPAYLLAAQTLLERTPPM